MFVVVYIMEWDRYGRHEDRFRFSKGGHKSVRSPHHWRVSGQWFDTREGAQEYADACADTRHAFVVEAPVNPFVTMGGEE